MGYQAVFKRYELKYMLTEAQVELLLAAMAPYMQKDRYGHATIRNIYFDTPDDRLVRHSIEKPVYKEKLRLRSYGCPGEDTPVFAELKKKYKGVVYKRRVQLPEQQAMSWLCHGKEHPQKSQITEEIDYFCKFYQNLGPKVFLSYERDAYYSADTDFRITLDRNIYSRNTDISLKGEIGGTPLLQDKMVLMELKTPGGIPLWMTRFLTEQGIFKMSFSKYGTAYRRKFFEQTKGERNYAGIDF